MQKTFKEKINPELIYQIVCSQLSSRKQKTAHTKDRREVRGGGRKPWRQKGTGRARHGSIRSPLWKGGGVTFGPRKQENLKKTIPLKMKRKAILMILSAKDQDNLISFTDKIKVEKTKEIIPLIKDLKSVLIIIAENDAKTVRAVRNIPNVGIMTAKDINALDLLQYQNILMEKEAVKVIESIK